jgi:hypothetical protein
MSWTNYHHPSQINYFAPTGTGWVDTQGGLSTYRDIIMVDGLVGNATSNGSLVLSDARSLLLTGFGFDSQPLDLKGIELVTRIERMGRVVDQTVQLSLKGRAIGRNQASDSLEDLQTYGGSQELWGTKNLDYAAEDFGLVLDLKPNPSTPSNERPIIREIMMRLYFDQ